MVNEYEDKNGFGRSIGWIVFSMSVNVLLFLIFVAVLLCN